MIDVHVYLADVVRVKDGDTVVLLVDQGFGDLKQTTFRLADIDTPETWRPSCSAEREHGEAATARLIELIEQQINEPQTFLQKYFEANGIEKPNTSVVIRSEKHGKYRWLAHLYPVGALQYDNITDAKSFNEILKDEGFEKRTDYMQEVRSE